MQFNLEKSERFKEEINGYKKVIDQIPDINLKNELDDLVKKLIAEVRAIDIQHGELFAGKKLPTMVVDSRQKIVELRKKISKKVDSWKKTQEI